MECWRTRHGPVVHGDPRRGWALALRYTATDGPCRAWETLRPMLLARTVGELHESQREWVDPVNNLVSADTAGNIAYLMRGAVPVRTSAAHRQFPAPGWTGEHEWVGLLPFAELPQAVNPPRGTSPPPTRPSWRGARRRRRTSPTSSPPPSGRSGSWRC